MEDKIRILFVQNLPERGITAIEAFKPDPAVSEMFVISEIAVFSFLSRSREISADGIPGLIVLDIEMPKKIQKTIHRELRRLGRKDIPVVMLDHANPKLRRRNGLS